MINGSVLCNCSIEADNHYLLESLAACNNKVSKLTMYFTINTAFANYLDIPERKESFLSGYADDHVIIHSFNPDDNNINQIIENDIGKIKMWMEDNQLKMNVAKTEFIVIGSSGSLRKNTLDHIKIGNTKIRQSSNIKFLGINLDEKLSFKYYIQTRSKKANYNLKLIRNI